MSHPLPPLRPLGRAPFLCRSLTWKGGWHVQDLGHPPLRGSSSASLGGLESNCLQHRLRLTWGEGRWGWESGRVCGGRGGDVATTRFPRKDPHIGVHPARLWTGVGGGGVRALGPRTKKPNLPACLHICPASGQSPAVPKAPPPLGPRLGAPRPTGPPFLHPLPSAQARSW